MEVKCLEKTVTGQPAIGEPQERLSQWEELNPIIGPLESLQHALVKARTDTFFSSVKRCHALSLLLPMLITITEILKGGWNRLH